jgi:cytochrome c oxidase subunit 2
MILDKLEKKVILATLALIGLFVFSLLYAKDRYDSDVPECLPYDQAYTEAKVNQVDSLTYEIFYVASMWQFQPAEVFIPVGSEVDLYLTSKDVVHGFNIAEKNVNMMAVYGALNKVRVRFDKPGIFDVVCHEYCGVGHQNMRSRIIVNYPN